MSSPAKSGSANGDATLAKRTKNIVACVDGTWCGDLTDTTTNIEIIAKLIAEENVMIDKQLYLKRGGNLVVTYFHGVGVGGDFGQYILDGLLAEHIKENCLDVYKFIVEHYNSDPTMDSKVWLFGLSRGAYTVRCLAGMINNYGILKKANIDLAGDVYDNYRKRGDQYKPKSQDSIAYRTANSHPINPKDPPIKFMGLLDTVGALGVPRLTPQIEGSLYEFYDTKVSGVVENVYQACATHDRFKPFEPTFITRPRKFQSFVTEEVWFPGAHYDIGRQRFVFLRNQGLEGFVHRALDKLNIYTVNFAPDIADDVLEWMLDRIAGTDSSLVRSAYRAANQGKWQSATVVQRRFRLLEYGKDAYDEIPNPFNIRGPWEIVTNRVPPFSLLQDRAIYTHKVAMFYSALGSGTSQAGRYKSGSTSGYRSRTYENYVHQTRPLKWIS